MTDVKTIDSKSLRCDERSSLELLSLYRGIIMGFAALWIFAFHEWQPIFANIPILGVAENFLKKIGFCGVDIFFFLSGMGLTYSINKSSLPKFYFRRIKRIILPFLAVGSIYLLIGQWDLPKFVANVTGINFYTKYIYSFLWFVPAILTLYIVFPLYYKLFTMQKQPVYFLVDIIMIWLLLSILLRNTSRGDLYGFTNRIPVFLVGIYLGWLSQSKKVIFTKATWITVLTTFILGLYLSYTANFQRYYLLVPVTNSFLPNLLIAISLPLLMAKFFDITRNIRGLKLIIKPIMKFFTFFGMMSLEFYCLQEGLCSFLAPYIRTVSNANIVIDIVFFLATTISAFIMYKVFNAFWKLIDKIFGL